MDNFSLFEEALVELENQKNKNQKKIDKDECKHKNIIDENGIKMCEDCGIEVDIDISFNKEWRYYGSADTRHNSDPNRCQIRKCEERTIYKDVEKLGFSDKIVTLANKLYEEVTQGRIYRGNSRKAIVFACIFHSYKMEGNPQSCENLINVFGLERKIGLRGLKHISLHAPQDAELRSIYITPENLIVEIMDKFDANETQKDDVIELYQKIKNKSSILNRSRPQSVASGLVRYYILLKNKDIDMKDFKLKVGLSPLTINRIVTEISRILNTPHLI